MSTAAEPMSLARPASAWRSNPMRSTVASMALLIELDNENEQHRGDQSGALHAVMAQPQGQGYDGQGERKFLTEGRFFPESTPQAADAGAESAHQRVAPRVCIDR